MYPLAQYAPPDTTAQTILDISTYALAILVALSVLFTALSLIFRFFQVTSAKSAANALTSHTPRRAFEVLPPGPAPRSPRPTPTRAQPQTDPDPSPTEWLWDAPEPSDPPGPTPTTDPADAEWLAEWDRTHCEYCGRRLPLDSRECEECVRKEDSTGHQFRSLAEHRRARRFAKIAAVFLVLAALTFVAWALARWQVDEQETQRKKLEQYQRNEYRRLQRHFPQ